MSGNIYPTIVAWLSQIQEMEPTEESSQYREPGEYHSGSPAQSLSGDMIVSNGAYFCPDDTGPVMEYLPPINSVYKGFLEVLTYIPSQTYISDALSTLPTHVSSPHKLTESLPHHITNPLTSVFTLEFPVATIESEYRRILDLRECLRVEEIFLEIQADAKRLYLNSPAYYASQQRLHNIRVLIIRTCQSLAYIKDACCLHELSLDPEAIDQRRILERSHSHPIWMIAPFLQPQGWNEFYCFDLFLDPIQINGGVEDDTWDRVSICEPLPEEGGICRQENSSAPLVTEEDSDSPQSSPFSGNYSMVLGGFNNNINPIGEEKHEIEMEVALSEDVSDVVPRQPHWSRLTWAGLRINRIARLPRISTFNY